MKTRCIILLMLFFWAGSSYSLERDNITCTGQIFHSWGNNPWKIAVSGRTAFFVTHWSRAYNVDNSAELHALDISDEYNPLDGGALYLPHETKVNDIAVQDEFAYIVGETGLTVAYVRYPERMIETAFLGLDFPASNVAISGDIILAGTFSGLLYIIDIFDGEDPVILSSIDVNAEIKEIEISGNYAFIGCSQFLTIDISDPQNPELIGSIDYTVEDMVVDEETAYLATGENGVRIIDLSDLGHYSELGHYRMTAYDIEKSGNLLYSSYEMREEFDGVEDYVDVAHINVLDVSNPMIPQLEHSFYPAWTESRPHFALMDSLLIEFSSRSIKVFDCNEEIEKISGFSRGASSGRMCRSANSLFVSYGNRRIAELGITHPGRLSFTRTLPLGSSSEYFRMHDRYLYTAEQSDYVYVYDLNRNIENEIEKFRLTAGHRAVSFTFRDNYMYAGIRANDQSGLSIIDVSNQYELELINHLPTNTSISEVTIYENYIFLSAGPDGIIIVDISDPQNLQEVGQFETSGAVYQCEASSHYLLVMDGDLQILDIRDPEHPQYSATLEIPGSARFVRSQGNFAYIAAQSTDDTPHTGLHVVNLTDPHNPEITGYHYSSGSTVQLEIDPPFAYVTEGRHVGIYDCSQALGIEHEADILLPGTSLISAYPNPFNSNARVNYILNQSGMTSLSLIDPMGREVSRLLQPVWMNPGQYVLNFNASDLTSGVYFLRLNSSESLEYLPVQLIR